MIFIALQQNLKLLNKVEEESSCGLITAVKQFAPLDIRKWEASKSPREAFGFCVDGNLLLCREIPPPVGSRECDLLDWLVTPKRPPKRLEVSLFDLSVSSKITTMTTTHRDHSDRPRVRILEDKILMQDDKSAWILKRGAAGQGVYEVVWKCRLTGHKMMPRFVGDFFGDDPLVKGARFERGRRKLWRLTFCDPRGRPMTESALKIRDNGRPVPFLEKVNVLFSL